MSILTDQRIRGKGRLIIRSETDRGRTRVLAEERCFKKLKSLTKVVLIGRFSALTMLGPRRLPKRKSLDVIEMTYALSTSKEMVRQKNTKNAANL